jgi:hypothetical protein
MNGAALWALNARDLADVPALGSSRSATTPGRCCNCRFEIPAAEANQ